MLLWPHEATHAAAVAYDQQECWPLRAEDSMRHTDSNSFAAGSINSLRPMLKLRMHAFQQLIPISALS